jgi:hypothetical protein
MPEAVFDGFLQKRERLIGFSEEVGGTVFAPPTAVKVSLDI